MSGTIQPARFLSHSGRIVPGVRRVVTIPAPAVVTDWQATVPAGVMWRIVTAQAVMVTVAGGGAEMSDFEIVIDGARVSFSFALSAPGASRTSYLTFMQRPGGGLFDANDNGFISILPDFPLPQGTVFGPVTTGWGAGDHWLATSMYVEETYFTDAQLSTDEIARETLQREEIQYLEQSLAQQGGGN